jgi:hypothetical protein
MYALIRKWEQSGLPQVKFLTEHRISKSTFGYWRKKYLREQAGSPKDGKMIPVQVVPDPVALTGHHSGSIEIVYPNGVRLVCPARMDTLWIKELIF